MVVVILYRWKNRLRRIQSHVDSGSLYNIWTGDEVAFEWCLFEYDHLNLTPFSENICSFWSSWWRQSSMSCCPMTVTSQFRPVTLHQVEVGRCERTVLIQITKRDYERWHHPLAVPTPGSAVVILVDCSVPHVVIPYPQALGEEEADGWTAAGEWCAARWFCKLELRCGHNIQPQTIALLFGRCFSSYRGWWELTRLKGSKAEKRMKYFEISLI